MKTGILILSVLFFSTVSFAQDSVKVERKNDTIHIGGMIIVKKKGGGDEAKRVVVAVGNMRKSNNGKISTQTWILDLGFANWVDKTNYANATSDNFIVNRPGTPDLVANDFKLKTIKSVNVNIWIFMQKLSLVQNYVNLKYGLGLELNNYRFKSNVSFNEGGANPYMASQNISHPFVFRDSISFSKNKLAADYVTVPLMINFNSNPENSSKSVRLSAGVSMGYLYSSRNKQKSDPRGKHKNRGDYDLDKWKFSYVGELGLGPVNLYGSYSPKSIFKNELNFTPYNIGIRFSNW
ncbi:MAG: outer membrane beta-barrel protein [Ginsengibacter sp.]